MMKTSVSLIILSFSLVGCTSTKLMIKGTVIDHTGAEIPKVNIETDPPTDYDITNNQGQFLLHQIINKQSGEITPLTSGKYTLILKKDGA